MFKSQDLKLLITGTINVVILILIIDFLINYSIYKSFRLCYYGSLFLYTNNSYSLNAIKLSN